MKTLTKCLIGSLIVSLLLSLVACNKTNSAKDDSAKEVLEFYHGYHHSESEWPVAKAMRDIYDEFASRHAGGG